MKERGEREMLISLPDYFGSNVVMVQIKKIKNANIYHRKGILHKLKTNFLILMMKC